MATARNLAESAYAHCVTGDMTACLTDLEALIPLRAATDQERHAVLQILDGVAAMLPQRLRAACGAAAEADCLRLVGKLCDDGLTSGADDYRPLAVGLLHGIRVPLQAGEVPQQLLTYARVHTRLRRQADKEGMHPDSSQLFGSTILGTGLALLIAAIAPRQLTGQPGNLLACMRGIAADTETGTLDRSYWPTLLQQAVRLGELELFRLDAANVDQRALAHLLFHIFQYRGRLAGLRSDKNAVIDAINDLRRLAVLARENLMPEEAWFIRAAVARASWEYPPGEPPYLNDCLGEAFVQAEECNHLRVAFLDDIISMTAVPARRYELALQRCWTAVRQTFASPGAVSAAGSKWRAATGLATCLEHFESFSLLDHTRWEEPQQWTQAMLPFFTAHPFPWRDFAASATFTNVPVKLVLTCAYTGALVVNSGAQPDLLLLPPEFHERFQRNGSAYMSFDSVGESIADPFVAEVSQLEGAGLLPVIRAFNNASRGAVPIDGDADGFIDALADAVAAKLDSVYECIRCLPKLAPADGEYFATAGDLSAIPWEQAFGRDLETACVCLHPASTGASTVAIANADLSANSRVGIIGDFTDSGNAAVEIAAIRACFGTNVEAFPTGSFESFQEAAARCQIIHIAAHGTQAWRDPRRNMLKFERTELAAADLAGLDLTGTALIVVNACDAAAPGIGPHAGEATIAGALLAAGANAVVGALWSVEDKCAIVFASALYRAITSGESLTKAYRSARSALRVHVIAEFGREHSFMCDAYRLFLRGRGS